MTEVMNEREILHGARAIADVLGITEKAVYHLIERGRIPHYRLGRTICARRSHLLAQADKLAQSAWRTESSAA